MLEAGVRLGRELLRHSREVNEFLPVKCLDCSTIADCKISYSNGQSEIVIGEAIKKFGWKRSDLVISTKVRCSILRH